MRIRLSLLLSPRKFSYTSLSHRKPSFHSTSRFVSVSARLQMSRLQLSDEEWKKRLTPEEYHILREKGTERAYTGKYDKHFEPGVYKCAGCGTVLYRSEHKFKSGCGWPAFYDNERGTVERHEDNSFGMKRIEIVCANCGGHLGHVFQGEGYNTPTDERHCVNSISLKFEPMAKQ